MDEELGLYDEIHLGKYQGELVQCILEQDKEYMRWAASNNILNFDEEVLQNIGE